MVDKNLSYLTLEGLGRQTVDSRSTSENPWKIWCITLQTNYVEGRWHQNYCGAAVITTIICMHWSLSLTLSLALYLCLPFYWSCHVCSYVWLIVRKVWTSDFSCGLELSRPDWKVPSFLLEEYYSISPKVGGCELGGLRSSSPSRQLCSALKTLKSKDEWQWVSKWQGHLLNCSGQLKTVCVGGSVKLQIMHLMTYYMAQKVCYFNATICFAKNKVTTDQLLRRWHTKCMKLFWSPLSQDTECAKVSA